LPIPLQERETSEAKQTGAGALSSFVDMSSLLHTSG
jgi:hypothetical protein